MDKYEMVNRVAASPDTHERPHHRVYRDLYKRHYQAPYSCFYCAGSMETLEVVHHLDEDPWNNVIENLTASHTICHNQHHHVGIVMSDESNAQRSATLKETFSKWTDEQRKARAEQARQTWTGRNHSLEAVEKIRQGVKKRPRVSCIGCQKEMAVNGLTRHNRDRQCPEWS